MPWDSSSTTRALDAALRGAIEFERQGDVLRLGEGRQEVEFLEHVADRPEP